RMIFNRRPVDARAIGGELLLRSDQRGFGAVERIARVLQLLVGDSMGACEPLPTRQVVSGPRDIGLSHRDGGLQLRGGRKQIANLPYGPRQLCLGLLERNARIGLIELHERLARLDELRSSISPMRALRSSK